MESLSICIITKDEEKHIFRCLKSIRNLAEEIIMVDTGSTDNTLNIAKDFKCRVFQIDWQDDFSAARNFALEQAQGQWILMIDADEELVKEDKKILHDFLKDSKAEGYFVQIINKLEHNMILKHRAVRLFRNRPEYRYTGRIHEQIAPAILKHGPQALDNSPLRFIHFGYHENVIGNKQERNIKILKRELADQPENSFMLFNLGTEYFLMADYQKARETYEKSLLFIHQEQPYGSTVIRNLAVTYLKLKEYQKCSKLLEKGISWYSDYTDLYYLEGRLKAAQGFLDKACESFTRCLELGETENYTSTLGVGSYLSLIELGDALQKLGKYQEALETYLEALVYAPLRKQTIERIPPLVIFTGKKGVLKELEKFDLSGEEYLLLADNFAYWEEYTTSLEIINYFTQNDFIKIFRAHCLLQQRKFAAALEELKNVKNPPDPVSFWSNVFLCACGLNEEELFTISINHLEKIVDSEQVQVFKDLVNTRGKVNYLSSPKYLSECWRLLNQFITLDLEQWFIKIFNIAQTIREFDTRLLTVNLLWNKDSSSTEEYLRKIDSKKAGSIFTVIEGDLNLEQGNYQQSWELFNLAFDLSPDDEFIRTGISLSALKQAEKLAKEALEKFDSELIAERLKVIEEEITILEKKYRFLRLQRRKEIDVLQTLLNSLYDS
ncbi:MAG: tetratricopeptide repeat-containing glycosyltransferase family 2 protein [Bacillota bacterium]